MQDNRANVAVWLLCNSTECTKVEQAHRLFNYVKDLLLGGYSITISFANITRITDEFLRESLLHIFKEFDEYYTKRINFTNIDPDIESEIITLRDQEKRDTDKKLRM